MFFVSHEEHKDEALRTQRRVLSFYHKGHRGHKGNTKKGFKFLPQRTQRTQREHKEECLIVISLWKE